MKRTSMIAGAILALAAVAPAANAQQAARPQQPPPQQQPSVRSFPQFRDFSAPSDPYRAAARDRQLFTQQLNRQALAPEPRERVERAYRVGALVDQGLCGPAAQLARAEHDEAMARRVPDACAAHRIAGRG